VKLEFDPTADAAYFEISSAPVKRTEEIEPASTLTMIPMDIL